MARVSPHKIPVDFGSADESTETMTFVLSLSGISEASAAQVAVLGILAARHVEHCGKRPVLNEAVKILARPGRSCAEMFEYIQNSNMTGLTRNTRSFILNTCKAMLMCDPVALRNSVANAVMVLTSESLRRSMEEEPGVEFQDGLDDDGPADGVKGEVQAVQPAAKATEGTKRRTKVVEKVVEDAGSGEPKVSDAQQQEEQSEPVIQGKEPEVETETQEMASGISEMTDGDAELAAVLEDVGAEADAAVILTNNDFGTDADPVFEEGEAVFVESANVVLETTQQAIPQAAEAANDKRDETPAATQDKRRFAFRRTS